MKLVDYTNNNSNPFEPEDYEFISEVIDYVTNARNLPIGLDSDDVVAQIRSKTGWFYEWAPYATISDNIVFDMTKFNKPVEEYLPTQELNDKTYRIANDTIILPAIVESVVDIQYITYYGGFGYVNAAQWRLESMLWYGMRTAHPLANVTNYMASVFISNTIKSMTKMPVAFEFNHLTKELKLFDNIKRTGAIVCTVDKRIPLKDLYKDRLYLEYIASEVLMAKATNMQLFNAKLPGDLSLNANVIQQIGKDLSNRVKQELEKDSAAELYIIKH